LLLRPTGSVKRNADKHKDDHEHNDSGDSFHGYSFPISLNTTDALGEAWSAESFSPQ